VILRTAQHPDAYAPPSPFALAIVSAQIYNNALQPRYRRPQKLRSYTNQCPKAMCSTKAQRLHRPWLTPSNPTADLRQRP
jgi:hypothetical protein